MDSLTFELTTAEDDERPVYLAGSFTDWYPDVAAFRMEKIDTGQYRLRLPSDMITTLLAEYKYTKGAWDQVELDPDGNAPANRKLSKTSGTIRDFVPHWRLNGVGFRVDLMPIVRPIKRFSIPLLNRRRKAYALLPHDYDRSDKRYPVLYLQDAQNLFGEGSSYGNWSIDRKLAVLAQRGKADVIVVAIEHGDKRRLSEYAPYYSRMGKGEGEEYVAFMADTLKPYVDKHFRTLPGRQHTGIGGSSMGGLISLFGGLHRPDIFGKMMIFSPSLWVSNLIYESANQYHPPADSYVYLYAGRKESRYMVPSVEAIRDCLSKGYVHVQLHLDQHGKHHEERWGHEFPRALEWLFFDT
jgi:predicted alpha/beta superfamily hydrolase